MFKKVLSLILCVVFSCVFIVGCAPEENSDTTSQSSEQSTSSVEYKIELRTRTYGLKDGERKKLDLKFTADGEDADWALLTFKSADPSIVTVDEQGVLTGVAGGATTVTITMGEKTLTAKVSVAARSYKLVLSKTELGLIAGQSATLTATAYIGAQKQENVQITWTSSNPKAVSVENGEIQAVGAGSAVITATFGQATVTANVTVVQEITADQVNSFDEQYVNIFGRSYITNKKLNFDHASNAIEVGIMGTTLHINLTASAKSYMRVWVDGVEQADRIKIVPTTSRYMVVSGLEDEYHKIRIVKATEMQDATWEITSFESEKFMTVSEKKALKIEFVGDSISAGYGSLGVNGESRSVDNSDSTRTYPYLTANKLNADYAVVAWSGICAKAYHWATNINMNTLYTYTSYKNKSNYSFAFQPDIIVLNLGTNEGSYLSPNYGGAAYGQQFPTDYKEMLTTLRSNNPNAYIICLYGMMGVNSVINSGITTAISQMNDAKIIYNPIAITPNTLGAAGHPSFAAQKGWADLLANYITNLNI